MRAERAAARTPQRSSGVPSDGRDPHAAALAPPAYGISFIDQPRPTRAAGPCGDVVQRVRSQVPDFDVTYSGTIPQVKDLWDQHAEFQQLMAEQFPGQPHELFYGLSGMNALLHEESLTEGLYTGTGLRLEKRGNDLNIFITHAHISPLDSNLHFGPGKPSMSLHRWLATGAEVKGMGFRVFDSMRAAGEALGLSQFDLAAIGDPFEDSSKVGYYVWTRFGFNADRDQFATFRNRVVVLDELDRFYAEELRGELAEAEAQMDADAPAKTLEAAPALETRRIELANKPIISWEPRSQSEELELEYIDKKAKYLKWTGLLRKHLAAVRWIAPKMEQYQQLNEIFLDAEAADMTPRVAALWKDVGSSLQEGVFSLEDPQHGSQRLFGSYKAAKYADLRRAGTSLAMLYGWSERELERRVRSGEVERDAPQGAPAPFDFYS